MSLIFERIHTEGIAELSYLVGDDSAGVAAVFDPTLDAGQYLRLARRHNLSITHIFETHIHADLVSGARELHKRAGSAKIHLSHEGGAQYGFDHEKVKNGDRFTLGDTVITAKHTPGHTPEHLAFLLAEKGNESFPWGVLTGDSLFVGSAGRPDLLGDDRTQELAAAQFRTLREFYLNLPDGVILYPAHGSGSPCGADIGDRLESTIGYERRFNPFLQFEDPGDFTAHALRTAPPVPHYYPLMKKINADGPEILGNLPVAPALALDAFRRVLADKTNILVDTRSVAAFGSGHIPGALNIGGEPMLSIWAGWLLKPESPILLVAGDDSEIPALVNLFTLTGYNRFAGYLAGGIATWNKAGLEIANAGQMSVHDIRAADDSLQIVDVRGPGEWAKGRIPGARHLFLPELREKSGALDRSRPVAVYCAGGYRAGIAASILKREGFDVSSIAGSWRAWRTAGFPVERAD